MTFVTGAFVIAGLAAMAAPILIHLLSRQRRRPIEWAAMRFLLEAFRKHKRRLRLEQLMLLATRCLIVALFGLALARPLLESAGMFDLGAARTVWLVIDNGVASSVQADAQQPSAIEKHIDAAIAVVETLNPGDRVGVITAGRPAAALVYPPSTDHGGVAGALQDLRSGGNAGESASDLPAAISILQSFINDDQFAGEQQVAYLFSEFRKGSAPIDSPVARLQTDGQTELRLLATPPVAETAANVQITAIDPVRNVVLAGQDVGVSSVSVRLARQARTLDRQVTTVRLEGDAIERLDAAVVQWQPGQSEAEVEFPIRFAVGDDREVAVTAKIDADALAADNQRHVAFDLRSRIRVLLVDRRSFGFEPTLDRLTAGQWMQRALEPAGQALGLGGTQAGAGGGIEVVQVEPAAIALADVRTADAAFVPRPDLLTPQGWTLLRQLVDRGGLVLVCPPHQTNVHGWGEAFVETFDPPWTLAMETREHQPAQRLLSAQPRSAVLRLLASELDDLTQPVEVYRSVPATVILAASEGAAAAADHDRGGGSAAPAIPLLLLADGSPLLLAAPAGTDSAADLEEGRSTGGAFDAAESDSTRGLEQGRGGGGGLVMYLAAAPAPTWTNLPGQPLMVPLMHEIVRQGLSEVRSSQRLLVGDRPRLTLWPAATSAVALKADDSPVAGASDAASAAGTVTLPVEPDHRLAQPLPSSGVYSLRDRGSQQIGILVVNVDPQSADTTAQSRADVAGWLNVGGGGGVGGAGGGSGPGDDAERAGGASWRWMEDEPRLAAASADAVWEGSAPLALYLIIAVVGLALLEAWLARRFSHAYRGGGVVGAGIGGGILPSMQEQAPLSAAGSRVAAGGEPA